VASLNLSFVDALGGSPISDTIKVKVEAPKIETLTTNERNILADYLTSLSCCGDIFNLGKIGID
jgi:hypothetical protein